MAYKPYPISTSDTNYQTTIADLKRMENSKISNKIIFGTDSTLKVTAKSTPNMSVDVSSGLYMSAGEYNYSSTSVNIPIANNTGSYPRIDAIVATINGINSCITVLKGTPSAIPTAPSCTATQYIKLAEVYVGVGVGSIQSNNITDCRTSNNQNIIKSLSDLMFNTEADVKTLNSVKPIEIYDPSQSSAVIFTPIEGKDYGILEMWGAGINNTGGTTWSKAIDLDLNGYEFIFPDRCSIDTDMRPEKTLGYNYWQGANGNFGRLGYLSSGTQLVLIHQGLTAGVIYVYHFHIRGFGRKK